MPCGSLPLRKLQSTLLEICTLVWIAAFAGSMPAITQPKPLSLRGVWRVAQLTTINSAGTTTRAPQPMLTIFTDKYYSFLWIQSDKPRPQIKDSASASADELRATWGAFGAQGGTYELSGFTVTIRPIVAKDPDMMNPGAALIYSAKFDGDQLELTFMRVDGLPRGANAPPYTIKMSRLE
jgi:hypothetical protein